MMRNQYLLGKQNNKHLEDLLIGYTGVRKHEIILNVWTLPDSYECDVTTEGYFYYALRVIDMTIAIPYFGSW